MKRAINAGVILKSMDGMAVTLDSNIGLTMIQKIEGHLYQRMLKVRC
jgi:hypothetical protein